MLLPVGRASPGRYASDGRVLADFRGGDLGDRDRVAAGEGAPCRVDHGLGRPLRRIGLRDTFAEGSRTAPYLFDKYGLSTQAVVDASWAALARRDPVPAAEIAVAEAGQYSPV